MRLAWSFMPVLLAVCQQGFTDQTLDLLQGHEWDVPSAPSQDADADLDLIRIASDHSQPNFIRARARATLTLYPNDRVWHYFDQLVAQTDSQVERRRAVDSLCAAFLKTRPARVESLVAPLLKHQDPHLRLRSVRCLRLIDSATARDALAAYGGAIAVEWERDAAGF